MRRFFLGFLALLVALGVASCGGGGGHDGDTGPNNSLRMSPLLSDVALSVGYVAEVAKISQGVKPYYVLSSDRSVRAVIADDDTLLVRGYELGTSTVTVQDSSVSQNSIKLTVTVTAKPLATSVGTALTLGAGESRTFTVTGGVSPYTVTSNNNSIATVSVKGEGVVTVTGQSKGAAALLITDDVGTTLQVAVTVDAPDFSVSPSAATGQVGTEMMLSILGGVGPYTAVSSAPSVATVQVSGDIARVQLNSAGTSTLTFRDSKGKSVAVQVTSTQTLPPLSISPTSGTGQVGTSVVFMAIGGAGPFTAVSSNPAIATVNVSGSTINVSLKAVGGSTITVMDSKGQNTSVSVTATPASGSSLPLRVNPPSGAGQVGTNMVLVVNGGTGPYSAVSSNPSFVTSSVSGSQIAIAFVAAGASTITVIDSAGASVSVPMTATSTVPALSVNPPTAIGQVGTSMSLSINGGMAPYTAATSNPLVASAAVNGNAIQVTFSGPGSTNLTVLDANSQSVVVPLTATYNALPLSASPEVATGRVGYPVVFTLVGGVGPYTAVSSNPDIASPSVNGATVTVNLLSVSAPPAGPGPVVITIRDSKGETITVNVNSIGEDAPAPGTFPVTPQNQSVSQHSMAPLTYTLSDGSGPYVASLAVADESIASATISGNTLTIGVGSSGNRCVGFGTRVVQVVVTNNQTGRTGTAFETIVGDGANCP